MRREGERLELRYVPLSQAVLWDGNPKQHDIGLMVQSIRKHGFRDPPTYDAALGALVEGNGRVIALRWMWRQGDKPPRGVAVDEETGEWAVPVLFGCDAKSREAAEAYALDHNNLTLLGGEYEFGDLLALYDERSLAGVVEELAEAEEFPVSLDDEALGLLLGEREGVAAGGGSDLVRWSYRVYFEGPESLRRELTELLNPYFLPRSRCKLSPEFFEQMVRSYVQGEPPVSTSG